MGIVYNKKLVFDYINGCDVGKYDIDKLEDDYMFMMDVIRVTNDKKMYNFCSDKVKNNYEFVKYMLNTFKEDKDFIRYICGNYLKGISSNDIRYMELVILMSDFLDNDDILDDGFDYNLRKCVIYEMKMMEINFILEMQKNDEVLSNIGLGFVFILEDYGSSEIISNFFASNFINKIFYESQFTLEELVHKEFKDLRKLEKLGINNYIINYINSIDSYLAGYVCKHLNLILGVYKDIIKIEKNWDNYVDIVNSDKINIFYYEIFSYIDSHDQMCRFSYRQIVDYVLKKLPLQDIFLKYDQKLEEDNHDDFEVELICEDELNFMELKGLKDIVRMAKELFKEDIIDRRCDDYYEFEKKGEFKSKILEIDFQKVRKK